MTTAFSAAGQTSPVLLLKPGQTATYAVTTSFVATVVLQKTNDNQNWTTVASVTSTTLGSTVLLAPDRETLYRWKCTAYTSGSPTVALDAAVDTASVVTNAAGNTVASVTDDGITTTKLNVDHTSELANGEIATTVVNTVTVGLGANQSNTALAAQQILDLSNAAGDPSYYIAVGGELDVLAADNKHLEFSTLYGLKGIISFKSAATSGNVAAYLVASEAELIIEMQGTSGTTHLPFVFGSQVISGPFSTAVGGTTIIDTYVGHYVPDVVLSDARTTITTQWNAFYGALSGASYFGSPSVCIGNNTVVAGAINHVGTAGFITKPAATQDAVKVVGRAGGTGSFTHTITTSALAASVTSTLTPMSGGANVTQLTSRTTGVTLNAAVGTITLVSAAGSSAWNSLVVTNSSVAAEDVIVVNVKTATDIYLAFVSSVTAGGFKLTVADLTGTTVESPVLSFAVMKSTVA